MLSKIIFIIKLTTSNKKGKYKLSHDFQSINDQLRDYIHKSRQLIIRLKAQVKVENTADKWLEAVTSTAVFAASIGCICKHHSTSISIIAISLNINDRNAYCLLL